MIIGIILSALGSSRETLLELDLHQIERIVRLGTLPIISANSHSILRHCTATVDKGITFVTTVGSVLGSTVLSAEALFDDVLDRITAQFPRYSRALILKFSFIRVMFIMENLSPTCSSWVRTAECVAI